MGLGTAPVSAGQPDLTSSCLNRASYCPEPAGQWDVPSFQAAPWCLVGHPGGYCQHSTLWRDGGQRVVCECESEHPAHACFNYGGTTPRYYGATTPCYDGGTTPCYYGATTPRYDGATTPLYDGGTTPRYDGGMMSRGISISVKRPAGARCALCCYLQERKRPSAGGCGRNTDH